MNDEHAMETMENKRFLILFRLLVETICNESESDTHSIHMQISHIEQK